MIDQPDAREVAARKDLLDQVELLGPAEVRQLANMAKVMSRPIKEERNPDSDLVGVEFAAEFRARLLAHHGTHQTGMDRLAFEAALVAASAAEGRQSVLAPSKTTRFWDLAIDGAQVSAKTSGAKAMRLNVVEISKLSEAAWIQDMRSARERRAKTLQLFADFVRAVQRWFFVRIFETGTGFTYELLEIPMWFFDAPVQALGVSEFDSDGPRIQVRDELGEQLFLLALDRSDAKITLKGIDKGHCLVHGTWEVSKGKTAGMLGV